MHCEINCSIDKVFLWIETKKEAPNPGEVSGQQSICTGNHRISSAIWNKKARVNFSKTNKFVRARRASAIWGPL